jgi:DNA-binding NarL/FixJ family response regulator
MSGEYSIFGTPPDGTGRPLTVVIADDQALVRGGFRLILKAAGINVVAEAADGAQAVAAVSEHRPDVVLMDVRMPVMDGIEATKRILADVAATDATAGAAGAAPTRIIILTTFDLDEYVYAALTAGASGFLLKDVTPEHLVAAVQLVRTGDALLAPSITRRLVERFAAAPDTAGQGKPARPGRHAGQPAGRPGNAACDTSQLTPREMEVLGLVARGLSNAEIASELVLSEATVKTHVARILTKLSLRDRVQAVVLAYETGLVSPATGTLRREATGDRAERRSFSTPTTRRVPHADDPTRRPLLSGYFRTLPLCPPQLTCKFRTRGKKSTCGARFLYIRSKSYLMNGIYTLIRPADPAIPSHDVPIAPFTHFSAVVPESREAWNVGAGRDTRPHGEHNSAEPAPNHRRAGRRGQPPTGARRGRLQEHDRLQGQPRPVAAAPSGRLRRVHRVALLGDALVGRRSLRRARCAAQP